MLQLCYYTSVPGTFNPFQQISGSAGMTEIRCTTSISNLLSTLNTKTTSSHTYFTRYRMNNTIMNI